MVNEVKTEAEQKTEEVERSPMLEVVRKVLMASIGAVALAQDEIENFVNKLVERGELAEQDGKKLVREVMEKRRQEVKKAKGEVKKAGAEVDARMEEMLARMNVPSKADIDALSAKITALSKKVDELRKPTA